MNVDFFKGALKYNASLTIIAVVILLLLRPLFSNIDFISNNPIIILTIFLVSMNVLVIALFYTIKSKSKNRPTNSSSFKNNQISGNKAKNIKIKSDGHIQGNVIHNNEADGDIIIGQGLKNEKK
ncbi:hypothetical protein [Proteus terrae]|uniref:hypothetical protein n=1 Tax=Proteus terrae TaxID=1574161 RepID=UPI000D69815E|nr:hypothetical protein [Proteus terrae]